MASFIYLGSPNTNLICCICRLPFTTPLTTRSCAHTFCQDCIIQAIEHAAQCPIDRSPLTIDDLSPADPIIRSLVEELIVECPHRAEGCQHTCQRQLLAMHLQDSCEYCVAPRSGDEQRERTIAKGEPATHQGEISSSEAVLRNCEARGSMVDSEMHLDRAVQSSTCEHCNAELSSSERPSHEESCPDYPVPCTHTSHGCPWKGPRRSLSTVHIHSCPYEAMKGFIQSTTSRLASFAQENILLRQKAESLDRTVKELKRESANAKAALGPWYQRTVDEGARRRIAPDASLVFVTAQPQDHQEYEQTTTSSPSSETSPASVATNELAAYFPPENVRTSAHRPSISMPHVLDSAHANTTNAGYTIRNAPLNPSIAPVNLTTSLEGSLNSLRESIVTLSTSVDSLARRNEIALTSESMRVNEELRVLRANMNGLRMQLHAIMVDQNAQVTGRVGGTAEPGVGGVLVRPYPHPAQMFSSPSITCTKL